MGQDLNVNFSQAKSDSDMKTEVLNNLKYCGIPENSNAYKKATACKLKRQAIARGEVRSVTGICRGVQLFMNRYCS